mgnify:CR=1 FL=1
MSIEDKLKQLNIILPDANKPVGSYLATKISGKLLFISGQISINDKGELFNYDNQVSHCQLISDSDDCEKKKCLWVVAEDSDGEENKGY